MDEGIKIEATSPDTFEHEGQQGQTQTKSRTKNNQKDGQVTSKRRCVSTACIACRRRKSKCDGNLPKCAACASVYLTECEYAPHTDHRRKGVYKKDTDGLKTKTSTLQTLIQALLNYEEEDAIELVKQMRIADSLEEVVQSLHTKEKRMSQDMPDSPIYGIDGVDLPKFDAELSSKMGDLFLDGSVKFVGGTSNLIWLNDSSISTTPSPLPPSKGIVRPREEAVLSWTTVTQDKDVILHFMNMYFCWHYAYFTTISKELFYRDFLTGMSSQYCSALLVNAMLALGCHFSSRAAARSDPEDSATTGDHYFAEARRLIYENDEFANAKLCTVQALALMSVREAGCGRESKGWVYSGMSFRMASDLGLNVDAPPMNDMSRLSAEDIDARRITYWGCFLFDKCWSNYLGRQPQLQLLHSNTKKFEVFPSEDSELWSPYTDDGVVYANSQPARTRAVALQISRLAEISSDLLISFYQPALLEKPVNKQGELKKLSDLHQRLEAWRRDLPAEMEPREGQLPSVLLMHMFYQLLYIHLYRPFLRYTKSTSPLPAHISPRKFCTQAAGTISKLLRLYKRTHGLRQVINKVVYIAHSACTIHLLNLPDKNAMRDIVHGVKQLEEMGECWIAARRTMQILYTCAEKWNVELPEEATMTFTRARMRWGTVDANSPAVSPDTITHMTHQITSDPIPDMMAQNIQRQRQTQAKMQQYSPDFQNRPSPASYTQTPRSQPSPHNHASQDHPYQTLHTSPHPTATHQSSLTGSQFTTNEMPSVTMASMNATISSQKPSEIPRSEPSRPFSSTGLTREQQNVWNAHQARFGMSVAQPPTSSASQRAIYPAQNSAAASLFGGVESLIEESQDWWFNDQNALAVGFDNWTAPDPDWSSIREAGLNHGGARPTTMNAALSNYDDSRSTTTSSSIGTLPVVGPNGLFAHHAKDGVGTNDTHMSYNHAEYRFGGPQRSNPAATGGHGKRHLSWDDEDEGYY